MTPLARGLVSVAGVYLIAAGLVLAVVQPVLNGAALIGMPLMVAGGLWLLVRVADGSAR